MFPCADQIALALVAAARMHGEDPLDVARGIPGARSRVVAYDALRSVFPDARRAGMARLVGFRDGTAGAVAVAVAKRARWWRDEAVDEIVGQLLGGEPDAEDDANPEPGPAPRPPASDHFDAAERKLIARMWRDGANEVSIGAALGSDADTVRRFMRLNPALCPARNAR